MNTEKVYVTEQRGESLWYLGKFNPDRAADGELELSTEFIDYFEQIRNKYLNAVELIKALLRVQKDCNKK